MNIVRVSYFFGTDPWLHITIIKMITEMNYLPLKEYYGSLGLHIFGAVIYFFSGVDIIFIPRYFVFYTILISALLFYNIFMRIFKNQSLAIFGVFILEFSSLGFSYIMIQFWPSHLALLLIFTIFFLLYVRLQNFIKVERPTWKEIFSELKFYYLLIIFIFISAVFTHSLTAIIFLLSYMWIFLIYLVKDRRRGSDFFLLLCLFGIFLLMLYLGFGTEHYWFLKAIYKINIPSYFLIAGAIGAGLLIWRFQDSILYTTGRYTQTINGKKYAYYKFIEDKIIIPLAFGTVIFLSILFIIGNLLWFDLDISNVFIGFEILIFTAFAVWGLILFQKKPRGKSLFIWGVGFMIILGGVFIFDVFSENTKMWARVVYMSAPIVVIGFLTYLYKTIKLKSVKTHRTKIFLLFIVIFSLAATMYHEFMSIGNFEIKRREANSVQWHSKYTSGKKLIYCEFGWSYIFMYFDYPYEKNNRDLRTNEIHYFLDYQMDLYPPENHYYENGTNKLQELKKKYGTDFYIILDDFYFLNLGWETYGELSQKEMDQYYDMNYLDKTYSARTESGEETPYFWVI
ncbi:MAG: hypothetical protein ACTSQJ_17110 [Promethearchaeota archaeon]